MSYFWYQFLEEDSIQVYFSQCKNGQWLNEEKTIVGFDYLDNYNLTFVKGDEDDENDVGVLEEWDMLLQVLNLEST